MLKILIIPTHVFLNSLTIAEVVAQDIGVGETQRRDFFTKPEIHFRGDRTRDIERDIEVEVLTITVETLWLHVLIT